MGHPGKVKVKSKVKGMAQPPTAGPSGAACLDCRLHCGV